MPCTDPKRAWPVGFHDSGAVKYYITEYEGVHHVEINHVGKPVSSYEPIISPYARKVIYPSKSLVIPCGQCLACRMKYSRDWADRIITELPYHKSAYFVTLTYDDEHLPVNEYVDPETGVIGSIATLQPRDVQLFFKRLRKRFSHSPVTQSLELQDKLMYFLAGEYGDKTRRPHYHAIIFGLELPDLVLYKNSPQGNPYYNSEILNRIWGLGYVVVADATWQSAAYTARYILKKQTGRKSEIYKRLNFEPEFTRMSLKPAIGKRWALEHLDELFDYKHVSVSTPTGGHQIRPSAYHKRLLRERDPTKLESYQLDARKAAETLQALQLSRTDKTYMELMEVLDEQMQDTVKRLPRPSI